MADVADSTSIALVVALLFGPVLMVLFVIGIWRIGTALKAIAKAHASLANSADDAIDEAWPQESSAERVQRVAQELIRG